MLQCVFEFQLGFELSGFSMWHFSKLVVRGFLCVRRFPPLLHQLMVQPKKQSWNKRAINSAKLSSWAVFSYHVAHDMLHVISARCVARDLHTIARGPLERTCWRQHAALWGECRNIDLRLSMRASLLLSLLNTDRRFCSVLLCSVLLCSVVACVFPL